MRKVVTILTLCVTVYSFGQDEQFSQYYDASLYLNPGFNGIYNDAAFHMTHKRQLQSAEIINALTQVSFLFPIKPSKTERAIGGVGMLAFNQHSAFRGLFDRSEVLMNYAPYLKFVTHVGM